MYVSIPHMCVMQERVRDVVESFVTGATGDPEPPCMGYGSV